jgi:mRNA interferase HigB
MRIIALKALRQHWETQGREDSKDALQSWYLIASAAQWNNPAEIKAQFRNASFVGERVVFNIAGNKYRLVTFVEYTYKTIYVRFIGTHAEYDEIDVRTI